jgi:parvulin-like peptidyl-prolyl isomerase
MVTVTYPWDKATDFGKALIKLMATPPPFVKILHMLGVADLVAGDKGYALYEVEDKKAYEGLVAIAKRMASYINVEGFRYTMEPLLTPEEFLPMWGLTPPK